jgi:hypothetical protein
VPSDNADAALLYSGGLPNLAPRSRTIEAIIAEDRDAMASCVHPYDLIDPERSLPVGLDVDDCRSARDRTCAYLSSLAPEALDQVLMIEAMCATARPCIRLVELCEPSGQCQLDEVAATYQSALIWGRPESGTEQHLSLVVSSRSGLACLYTTWPEALAEKRFSTFSPFLFVLHDLIDLRTLVAARRTALALS